MEWSIKKLIFLSILSVLATYTSLASAISPCGTFEMVPMPGRALLVTAFEDGTATAIGGSAADPAIPVLRHFDGDSWSEQSLPSEVDGYAFGAAGRTPDGHAWFAGTRAYTVYEVGVVFMRVEGGSIEDIDFVTSPRAPVDISGTSSDDVWALTSGGDVIHFDGASWQVMDVPEIYSRLYPQAIHAASPDDVWIAGYGGNARGEYIGYIQHWNGASWVRISTPFDNQDPSRFLDVDGSGSNDIWVSGGDAEDILLHWDGNAWTRAPGPGSSVARVLAMEPDNAWAVTNMSDVVYYWNGDLWSEGGVLDFPGSAVTISLRDLAKAGTCDAWIVGDYYDGTAYQPWAARLIPGEVSTGGGEDDASTGAGVLVGAIDITRIRAPRKSYYAQATLTILDGNSKPIEGAVVAGNFSGPSNESLVAASDAGGVTVFSSGVVSRPEGSWCFSVTGIRVSDVNYATVTSVCE